MIPRFANTIVNYTDPSGKFVWWPIAMLGGAIAGGLIGGALGDVTGALLGEGMWYRIVERIECGCDLRDETLEMGYTEFVRRYRVAGSAFGAFFGAMAGLAITGGAIGGIALLIGGSALVSSGIISVLLGTNGVLNALHDKDENGWNICNITEFILSGLAITAGVVSIIDGAGMINNAPVPNDPGSAPPVEEPGEVPVPAEAPEDPSSIGTQQQPDNIHSSPGQTTNPGDSGVGEYNPPASAPTGSKNSPLDQVGQVNVRTTINGRSYSGHALDQMQARGFTPSVVENTIQNGYAVPTRLGRVAYYDPVNHVTVVTDSTATNIITVRYGSPRGFVAP